MSRIFDALQRMGTEQSGTEYPDMMSVATEVLEAPEEQTEAVQVPSDPETAAAMAAVQDIGAESPATAEAEGIRASFPTLQVTPTTSSRLVFLTEPDGLAAEKFRFLGVRLRQLQRQRPLKKVLVTSSIPEEGKSLVSANLAGVLAGRRQNVLLLEGDIRRPVQAQQLGLGGLAGLAEWLQSGTTTLSNIYYLSGPGYWLMPAGISPENPLELLQSGRVSQLMNQLATLFDWIIVDSPPLLPLADTTVWTRFTDGTLLVAREGVTEKGPLQRGLEILQKSDLLGVVLNGRADLDSKNYYQRYYPPQKNKPTQAND
jgi:capsular exopolysaccharide synthesis family protein